MTSTALTIGNFDGVHIGHVALVRRARELVGASGRVVALAFDPHPASRLKPGSEPERLSSFEQREVWLRAAGADSVERLEPTPALLGLSPEAFVRAKVEKYAPSWFVEGADFHFGKGRAGNVRTLAELGPHFGFACEVVAPVEAALTDCLLIRASSTLVRWLLSQGRVRDAAIVLGRPYELAGTVVQGDRRGREIGVPTANLATDQMLPADGVYAGVGVLPDGREVPAAVNVGSRPTFNGHSRRLEAYLLIEGGWRGACGGGPWAPIPGLPEYGWPLRVRMQSWIREDLRFEGVKPLCDQMARDIERCRQAVVMA